MDKIENNFDMRLLSKLFSLSIFLFVLFFAPSYANRPSNARPFYRFYAGFSLGYTATTFGGMESDYAHEMDAWHAPGSFKKSDFQVENAMPLQFSVGASVNNNIRIDVSYLRYSDISMEMNSHGLLPLDPNLGEYAEYRFLGDIPDIKSNAMMLNVYYNLDRLVGRLVLRPYIGAGIGMASNSLSDYVVHDNGFYILPGMEGTLQPSGTIISIRNIRALHKGGTTTNVAWAVELGFTHNLTDRFLVDFFGRYVNLGSVESNGSIFVTQEDYGSTNGAIPVGPPYNRGNLVGESSSSYQDWQESGNLSVLDIGVRFRLQF